MHLQSGNSNKEARAAKLFLLIVIAQDVADILTKKTLDAFTKFLDSIDVALIHLPLDVRPRRKRRDLSVDSIIPGHVCYQISDNRKTLHRLDSNGFIQRQRIHASFASQAWSAIDFGRARATFARLAVPTDRQIGRLMRLDIMNCVEHNHSRGYWHLVL